MPARIAISMGDPSGIGPEVTARALAGLAGEVVPYVFGDARLFARAARRLGLAEIEPGEPLPPGGALVRVSSLSPAAAHPGRPSPEGGAAQLAYLEAAYGCVASGAADALCTAPVSKAQVALALPGFVGHTEWLEARTRTRRSVMMLAGPRLRVALVTNHLPLAAVRRAVTAGRIAETIAITDRALRRDFGIGAPRIAVCAMNPHAGDGGVFGDEERRVVAPAIARARRARARASGPFPADSIFFRAAAGEFDAVVALYHDQGLIPVKLLDAVAGEPAVNVTLGLPIVRTSPDHGVAYDIAGRGRASAESMIAAIELAARIARNRGQKSPRPANSGLRRVARRSAPERRMGRPTSTDRRSRSRRQGAVLGKNRIGTALGKDPSSTRRRMPRRAPPPQAQ